MSGIPSYAHTSPARSAQQQYDLAFQVSPIILQGGIAANAEGGLLPIIALYNQQAQLTTTTDPNAFFARYLPLPGSTLLSNAIGTYPFANAQVAANAIIQQPLTLSMMMIAPVNQPGGYQKKLSIFSALQKSLQQHCAAGGRFTVATPAMIYDNLLLTSMTDTTHSETQMQIMYQIDFVQPLLTLTAATAAQQALMQRITNGGKFANATWSGNLQAAGSSINGLNGALGNFGGDLRSGNFE